MKKMLLLAGAMLAVTAVAALAAPGVQLTWTNCPIDGGTINKTFACTSSSGTEPLIMSWQPSAEVPLMNGAEGFVDLYFPAGSAPPAWWLASCAAKGGSPVSITAALPASAVDCADAWNGNGIAALAAYSSPLYIQHGVITPGPINTTQIDAVCAVPAGAELDALPGTEYFLFAIGIKRAGTTGGTACTGCNTPVTLNAQGVWVTQPAPAPQIEDYTQNANSIATVQNGGPVPTQSKTWGALKAMYR